MSRHFIIVIPEGDRFEIGLADGLYPWTLLVTCTDIEEANRIGTLLAMHYRVRAFLTTPGEVAAAKSTAGT